MAYALRLMIMFNEVNNLEYLLKISCNFPFIFRGLSENQEKAFRESYGQLGQLRAYLKDVPFVCLSATAPKTVVNKVTTSLRLVSPNIIEVEINKVNIW